MNFFIIFVIATAVSVIFTVLVKIFALKFNVVDTPGLDRKIHKTTTPLLGGGAIFMAFFLVLFFMRDVLVAGELNELHWLGFFVASFILILGGFLDDKFNLAAKYQIISPFLAVIIILAFGVSIEKISNPFGEGLIYLDYWKLADFFILSALLIFTWLMGMMYTTKLLDGLDGLVTGVTMIGGFIIFLFTITEKYSQPDIAVASLILSAVCFGFLIFNWHPASIFLGEGGSLFLGFALGVLAIISGGKIAVALLVMGIPIMDLAWTIVRRLKKKQNPFKISDREHLHFRLLDTGIGQRKTVLLYYITALGFGLSALFLQSKGKMAALGFLFILMFLMIYIFKKIDSKKHSL